MTPKNITQLHSRLAIRGLPVRSDPAYLRMLPWTRIAFAISGFQVATAVVLALTPMLWTMVPVAILAVIMPHHLFEYFYNHGIRRVTQTEPLPPNGPPTRFAFAMMALMLIGTATAFEFDHPAIAYGLGAMIVSVSGLVCVTHFCVPAAIYKFVCGDRAQVRCALEPGWFKLV